MLDAEAMVTTEEVWGGSFKEPEVGLGNSGEPLEHSLQDLVSLARRVLSAVRVSSPSRLSARARADLDQARSLLTALGAAMESSSDLTLSEDGTWFQAEGGRIDVARRGAVRRILVALAKARVESPTKTLGVDALFELGWPGERIPYESQVRRVYTAIWTLRTLGLDGYLLTREEGYLLDPKRQVRFAG